MSFAIIQCGSSARGDTNINSDIDIICIWSDAKPDYKKLMIVYGDVMFYSFETIKRMKSKGSLFLTHLDIDGILLEGDPSLLETFRGFRPTAHQLKKQLRQTAEFVSHIDWYPDSPLGRLWLCDVLYVSLRTCLYLKNALSNKYVFGFLEAMHTQKIAKDLINIMLDLREAKYIYRKFGQIKNDEYPFFKFDISEIEIAGTLVLGAPLRLHPKGSTSWTKITTIDYWTERLIERAIINQECRSDQFLENMKRHNYNKFILKADIVQIIEAYR